MKLSSYAVEIFDIAKENNVAWDVGMDMFMTNIAHAGEENYVEYKGANLDYSSLDYNSLDDSRQEFVDLIRTDIHNEAGERVSSVYKEFCNLHKDRKLDEARALIEHILVTE